MWVFGYGSLMWGGWEESYDCMQRVQAELHGYRRAFNKASIANWGTPIHPCPTLNLIADATTSCVGMAFEFPASRKADVEAYLARREGKNFALAEMEIFVRGDCLKASVPLYSGKNILSPQSMLELSTNIREAFGTSGACVDYVANLYAELTKLGIDDPAVTELWNSLCS